MRRNHKLESKLAEEIVGYVLVNTDDYFAAEKVLTQQTNNKSSLKFSDIIAEVTGEIFKDYSPLTDREVLLMGVIIGIISRKLRAR